MTSSIELINIYFQILVKFTLWSYREIVEYVLTVKFKNTKTDFSELSTFFLDGKKNQ